MNRIQLKAIIKEIVEELTHSTPIVADDVDTTLPPSLPEVTDQAPTGPGEPRRKARRMVKRNRSRLP